MRTWNPALFASSSALAFIWDRCRGLLGNSSNSDAPHLHFQICDANSVLGCEGPPYAISSFDVEGRSKPDGSATTHSLELPTEGEVVRFNPEH